MKLPPKPGDAHDVIDDPHALIDEVCRNHLPSFLYAAYPIIRGGANLIPNWHIDAMCHELDRIRAGDLHQLLVTIAPRNLKSITMSVAFVAFCLGLNPRMNFVCVSYAEKLARKHALDCRSLMQSAWYRRLFPNTVLSKASSSVLDFETTAGGGRLATSVGGTLTGRGGDIIILDDPINPLEANSDVVRDNVNDWFASTLSSRLNDKMNGAIIVVMQRLHQYDLVGMLLETGDWHELSLPAIAMEDTIIPLTRGRAHYRKEGDLLHPQFQPLSALMKQKKTMGSAYFNTQYQQNPVPAGGNMVKAHWFQYYHCPRAELPWGVIYQSWDTASKDGVLNDYSVCITALVVKSQVYIIDVFRQKLEFPELKAAAIRLARFYEAKTILIEDQASGTQLIQALRHEQPKGVVWPTAVRPEGDKKSRMAGVTGQISGGQLVLPHEAPFLADFKSELLSFPNGRFFDQADALTQLMDGVMIMYDPDPLTIEGPRLLDHTVMRRDEYTGSGNLMQDTLNAWFS